MSENSIHSSEHSGIKAMYHDELTQKKIHEHLNNEKDVITEQDIANIRISKVNDNPIDLNSLSLLQENDLNTTESNTEELEDKKIRDNEDPEIGTA
jgi:hypothetical protein